tara:strand:+ start:1369 stop:1695 length:327 start_codon:yes stop_codon:yes gene_type:complete
MYIEIQPEEAYKIIKSGRITIVDIRDFVSFNRAHIKDAQLVGNENIEDFVRVAQLNDPLLVYCYRGNSSQPAAEYFVNRGFKSVYHLVGGFDAWCSLDFPTEVSLGQG